MRAVSIASSAKSLVMVNTLSSHFNTIWSPYYFIFFPVIMSRVTMSRPWRISWYSHEQGAKPFSSPTETVPKQKGALVA
jgi:hypothetical protein